MNYWDFIEEQRSLIQLGELEEHHVYPAFDRQTEETVWLSQENHAIASVLQSREWDRQCIHGRQVQYLPEDLKSEGGEWSNWSMREWIREKPEELLAAAKKAGKVGQKSYQNLENHAELVRAGGSAGGTKSNREWRQRDPEAYYSAKKKASDVANSTLFRCKETGFTSTAAGVVARQKRLKIDTSPANRERI
jgi:hypothetical protein